MKTTSTKPRFQQPAFVPPMPNPETTVEGQQIAVKDMLGVVCENACAILKQRQGQGKPCPVEINDTVMEGAKRLGLALYLKNDLMVREALIELITLAVVEGGEHSYAQVA